MSESEKSDSVESGNTSAGKSGATSNEHKKAVKYLKKTGGGQGKDRGKFWLFGLVGVFVVVIVGGAFLVSRDSSSDVTGGGGEAKFPAGVSADNPGWVANSANIVGESAGTIEVFEDFQCPACEIFETAYGSSLKQYANENNVALKYYPMVFLDANLRNTSSAQSTNAFACAINQGVGVEYHDVLFANHPKPEGSGWTVNQLKGFGSEAGLSGAELAQFEKCVSGGEFLKWGRVVNQFAQSEGVQSTPTVRVNGTVVDRESLADFASFQAKLDELLQK